MEERNSDPTNASSFVCLLFRTHFLTLTPTLTLNRTQVLFMCTANVLHTIPGPLRDRMEVIELAGYISGEKVHISRRHLQPKVMREAGVPEGATRLTDTALHALIDQYCREPGVRALQQHLEKLYRKLALRLVRDGARREEAPEDDPALMAEQAEVEQAVKVRPLHLHAPSPTTVSPRSRETHLNKGGR